MSDPRFEKIEKILSAHKVVLFVKGTPAAPQCGFSAATMELFKKMKVPFHSVDVLAEPEFRVNVPEYSQWPTFPQIFVKGKLVGGCDIVHELYQSGELAKLVG